MKKIAGKFKIAASSKKLQAGLARKESHKSEVSIDTSRPAYPGFFESPNEFGREPLSAAASAL